GAERTVELAVHPGGGAANWSEFLGQPGGTVRGLWHHGRAGRARDDWRRPARADEPGGRDARLPGGAGDRDAGRRTAAWSDDSPRRLTDLRLARQRRTGVDGASVFATQVLGRPRQSHRSAGADRRSALPHAPGPSRALRRAPRRAGGCLRDAPAARVAG